MATPCPAIRPLGAEFFEHPDTASRGDSLETARNRIIVSAEFCPIRGTPRFIGLTMFQINPLPLK
jgi:hypothetical protein